MQYGILVDNGDIRVIGPFYSHDEAVEYRDYHLGNGEEVVEMYHPQEATNALM